MNGLATQCGMSAPVVSGGGGFTPPAGLGQWHYGNNTEVSGAWTDQSGNGNHATLNGAASVGAEGLTGGATNSDFADISATIATGTYSFAVWLNIDAGVSGDVGLFGPTTLTNSIFWADKLTGPVWRIGSNSPARYGGSSSDKRSTWCHFAWVADAGDIEYFIDGVSDGSSSGNAPDGSTVSQIGRAAAGKNMDSSKLDDVMIYNSTALTSTQIADIYNNSPGSHV